MALPTTGLTGHYDASNNDDLWKTFVSGGPHTGTPADGDSVQVWDQEGALDRIFKQNGANAVPVWRTTTPLMPLACLDFTGGQQLFLRTNSNAAQVLSTVITNSACTVLVAFYAETITSTASTGYQTHPLIADAGGFWGLFLRVVSSQPKLVAYNYDGTQDYVTLDVTAGATHVAMLRHQSGTLYLSLDGGAESSVASGNTNTLTNNVILGAGVTGGTSYDGRIGEIAIYNTALTGTDLTDAVSYFTAKWLAAPPATVTARVTQDVIEVLTPGTPATRLSQDAIEVLTPDTPFARLTQHALEVLYYAYYAPDGGGEVPAGPPPQVNPIPTGVVRLFFELQVGNDPETALAVMSAETTLSDPGFWFYGQKPGRLLTAAIDPRELSDSGDFRGVTARLTLADIAGTFRALANTHTLAGAYGALYAVADEVRYAFGDPTRLFAGRVSTHRAKPGLQYEFTLIDVVSEYVANLDASPRVPPDRISTAVFGVDPSAEGKALPIVLGKSSDYDEPDIPSNAQGVVPAMFLGTTNLHALDPTAPDVEVDAYVWSQSAIVNRGITDIFWNDPDHPETRLLVSDTEFGVNAWTPGKPGWPALPYPQYLDYAGHRYTPLLVRHADPRAKAIRDGNSLLAANMYGIEENGDSTGRYFDDPATIWQWIIVNQLCVPYTTGSYAVVPTLTPGPGYGMIDTDRVAIARARHDARITGGYVVGFLLGRNGQQQTLRHVLGELCFGTNMEQGINWHGQAMVSVCDPDAAPVAEFTDRADIEDGTFEMWVDREGWFDILEYSYGFRYWPPGAPKATPAEGEALPATPLPPFNEWTSGLKTMTHDDAIAVNLRSKTQRVENYVVRETSTAFDWATQRLARAVGPAPAYDGARMFRMTTGWQGVAVELGDVIRMTHLEGYTPACTGYVTKIGIDPQQARITLEGRVLDLDPPTLTAAQRRTLRWPRPR